MPYINMGTYSETIAEVERFRIRPLMAVTVRWTLVALAACATLSHSENDWQLCLNGTDANCCSSECYVLSFSTKVTYY